MDNQPSPPRLQGVPLFLARTAALLISVGVVVIVILRASGCSSGGSGIQPEARSANPAESPPSSATAAATAASKPGATGDEDIGFMGGAKAPAGNWAKPRQPASQQAAPAQPPAQAPNPPAANAPANP